MPEFSMQCPHCKSQIGNIPAEKEGQIIICMECGKTVQATSAAASPAPDADEIKIANRDDIILGDKVSDSEMDGFESFEAPEEEEVIEEAELIRDRFPWRTSKFMGIVCDILFLLVAIELAFCAYTIYQAQTQKINELPARFAEEQKNLENTRKSAQNRLEATRKKIKEQVIADENEKAVFHNKKLMAEADKIKNTKIEFPAKIDPEQKPILKENPYLFFLNALQKYSAVKEENRNAAVNELIQHLKNVLEEIKSQRKYDRVAVVEEIIEPFLNAKIDLSEVSTAAKAVIQFEKDEKLRIEQEAKDKIRREKERLAEIERRRREALVKFANYKNQINSLTKQLHVMEDQFDLAELRPIVARTYFSKIFLEKSRNPDGSLITPEQLLKLVSGMTDTELSTENAKKLCTERFNAIEKEILNKFPETKERAAAEKLAKERFPEIKRGQNVVVVYLQGNAKYSYKGPFIQANEQGVRVGSRTFPWNRLDPECRKKLDPQTRKNAIDQAIKVRMNVLRTKQERGRNILREQALKDLFQSGIVMQGKEILSSGAFVRKMYPAVQKLYNVRSATERVLLQMYPFMQTPLRAEEKLFVAGLQEEFGLKNHSNIGKAMQLYEKAASKCIEAQVRLGDIYSAPRDSIRGIEPNRNKALRYYRMAEKQKNEYAQKRIKALTARRPAPAKKNNTKQNNKKK